MLQNAEELRTPKARGLFTDNISSAVSFLIEQLLFSVEAMFVI